MTTTPSTNLIVHKSSKLGSPSDRNLYEKLNEIISVVDFGAKGDGTTDDSAAFQAAVNYCQTRGGGKVYVPAKTYLFSSSGVSVPSKVIISGEQGVGSTINWNGTGPAFYYHPTGSFASTFAAIENITINGGSSSVAKAIEISDTFGFRLENISIYGFTAGEGLVLRNINFWTEGTVAINVRISNCLNNLVFRRDSTNTWNSFGYTRFFNCSINANAGQTAILHGDDSTNMGSNVIYNAILNINCWLAGNSNWITFGKNAVIRESVGTLGGEEVGTYTGTGWPANTATSGLYSPELFIRSTAASNSQNQNSMVGGSRYYRSRELGVQAPGTSNPTWFKIAVINPTQGLFAGQVVLQGQYGQASYNTATATFSFGVNGNGTGGFVPAFHVIGNAFNGSSTNNWSARFIMAYDGTNYNLYFRRPSYAFVCTFNYTFDWTTGLTYDPFVQVNDPTTDGTLTVVYDSFNNGAQGVYCGDEQVFTGQRIVLTTNGSTTVYLIPHHLNVTPQYYNATAINAASSGVGIKSVSADATNVIVTMNSATPAGTGNVQFAVEWARAQYNKGQRT